MSENLNKINNELKSLRSSLYLKEGRSEFKNRFNQFFGFDTIDFWENGICLQSGVKVNSIQELALLVYYWCELRLPVTEIEKMVPTYRANQAIKLIQSDISKYLEYVWEDISRYSERFSPLIKLLKENEIIKKLMPYRQLYDLGLSRYIGLWQGQFINDLPRIRAIDYNRYKVITHEQAAEMDIGDLTEDNKESFIGVGNAEKAMKMVLDNLPKNLGQAHFRTLDEWEYQNRK